MLNSHHFLGKKKNVSCSYNTQKVCNIPARQRSDARRDRLLGSEWTLSPCIYGNGLCMTSDFRNSHPFLKGSCMRDKATPKPIPFPTLTPSLTR